MTKKNPIKKGKLRELAFKMAEYQIKNDSEDVAILIEKVQGKGMSTYAIKIPNKKLIAELKAYQAKQVQTT